MLTRDNWLARHPYLRSLADLAGEVESVLNGLTVSPAPAVNFDAYRAAYASGIPLLHSSAVEIDVEMISDVLMELLSKLSQRKGGEEFTAQCRFLHAQLSSGCESAPRAIAALLQRTEPATTHLGMLRYLVWKLMQNYCSEVLRAFDRWRPEEQWLLSYCPACAGLPTMAQLTGREPGRMRYLHCPCCGTRWRFRRTGCPFCERPDDHRLSVTAIEGQGGLRLDSCESCNGYLKTYDGEGNEALLFSEWATLHLDVLAQDRGLIGMGTPLLDIKAFVEVQHPA